MKKYLQSILKEKNQEHLFPLTLHKKFKFNNKIIKSVLIVVLMFAV